MPLKLLKVLMLLAMISLTGCGPSLTTVGGTTNKQLEAVCGEMVADLPTRSKNDTPQTAREIELFYQIFAAVCPTHAHLIPT